MFVEYKTAAAADAARLLGLERQDVQVIKICNNDMLRRKFRELAHGPIRDHDPRKIESFRDRFSFAKKDLPKHHGLPAKPIPFGPLTLSNNDARAAVRTDVLLVRSQEQNRCPALIPHARGRSPPHQSENAIETAILATVIATTRVLLGGSGCTSEGSDRPRRSKERTFFGPKLPPMNSPRSLVITLTSVPNELSEVVWVDGCQ